MKFSAGTGDLRGALAAVNMALQARTVTPILESVLMVIKGSELTLTGSDSTVQVSYTIPCDADADGQEAIRGKLLEDVVRKMPEDEITFEVDKNHGFTVRSGRANSRLAGTDPVLYPARINVDAVSKIILPANDFCGMIAGVKSCVATDETRPILMGGCVDVKDGVINMVGLDGFRLGVMQKSLLTPVADARVVIPLKALAIIEKLLASAGEENAELNFSESEFEMSFGAANIKCALINGEYVNWQSIVPKSFTTLATVNASQFRGAVERAALMARMGTSKIVKLSICNGGVSIYASSGTDDMQETVDADIEGADMDIQFNVRYISDAISMLPDGNIVLHLNAPFKPCVLCATQEIRNAYWMVLPVRM